MKARGSGIGRRSLGAGASAAGLLLLVGMTGLRDHPMLGHQAAATFGLERGDSLRGWKVTALPQLELGGPRGDERQQFVNVVSAATGPDGSLFIADRGLDEVRWFASDGLYFRTFGGRGDGPGEFRDLTRVLVDPSMEVVVFDRSHQRLTRFSVDGEVMTTARSGLGADRLVGDVRPLADGRLLARTDDRVLAPAVGTMLRDTVEYYLFTSDLRASDFFVKMPGAWTATMVVSGVVGTRFAPFTSIPSEATFGNCIYLASGEDAVIRILSPSGSTVASVGLPLDGTRVTRERRTEWAQAMVRLLGDDARGVVQEAAERSPTPSNTPKVHSLLVDALGFIWVQPFHPPLGPGRTWWVLQPDGSPLGTLRLPVDLIILEVGASHVLGAWRDELGVERVRVYGMERPEGASFRRPPNACVNAG
jgi:hypothetical protein